MSTRDKMRSLALKGSEFRKEIKKIDGMEFEVRQPSRKARKEIVKKCTSDDGAFDSLDFIVWAAICCTYVPGTNELVFDPEDYDSIMEGASGGIIEELGAACAELMNIEADIEEDAKNS